MENREVIHMEEGSTVELPKGWFKKYAPLEFFETGDDPDEGEFVLMNDRIKRIKNRLNSIKKDIRQFRVELMVSSNPYVFIEVADGFHEATSMLNSAVFYLEETMRFFYNAKENFTKAKDCDTKGIGTCLARGCDGVRQVTYMHEQAERMFKLGESGFAETKDKLAKTKIIPSEIKNGFEKIEFSLVDALEYISQKIKIIDKEAQRLTQDV